MEGERVRPSRRRRKGSRSLARPDEPPETMPVDQASEATAPSPDTKNTIARSMSRYKGSRPNYPRSTSTPAVPAMPPLETSTQGLADMRRPRPTTTFDHVHSTSVSEDDDDEIFVPPARAATGIQSLKHPNGSPEARRRPRPEYNVQAPHNGVEDIEFAPADYLSKEPSRHRHLGRSRAHEHRSRHAKAESQGGSRGAIAAEQNKRTTVLPTRPAMVAKKSFTQKIAGFMSQPQSAAEAKEQLKQRISHPIPIEAGEPLQTTQFDAPKSAVNAGERTVRVKYKDFKVPVTIVPSTTPIDLIQAVAEKVAIPIHQDSVVVLESFKQLGLERPLRKYEHVRDVLNSWDDDAQNTLTIEPSATGGHDDDLNLKNVPRKQPHDSSFYLHHSQRPGHWEKRVVTLRSDGQILVAKSSGSESSNICHLSDFDIYIPTARQIAKKIKPPKRVCFAVKSQQKSNMFMSTINFVHFFCSNDKELAKSLYTAVQQWRSWYLVNKMGKGIDHPSPPPVAGRDQAVISVGTGTESGAQPASSSRQLQASNNPVLQQAQCPIPCTSPPTRPNIPQQDDHSRKAPPAPYLKIPSAVPAVEGPFTNGGLLGRAYTQRKKKQQNYEARPSDVPRQIPAPIPPSVKVDPSALKRTSSQRQKIKPLVDLTPLYQEPPQHVRKGRGVTPGQIPARGLIDIATSPEVAIPIPPTNSWRRPGTSSGAEVSPPGNRSNS